MFGLAGTGGERDSLCISTIGHTAILLGLNAIQAAGVKHFMSRVRPFKKAKQAMALVAHFIFFF